MKPIDEVVNFKSFFSGLADLTVVLLLAAGTMVASKLKDAIKKRSQKRFEKGIENNFKVKELMSELRVLCSADRVKLFQFHNGEYYTSGESIMKASLTHIVLKTGVSMPGTTPSSHQNIPTTHIIYLLNHLSQNDDIFVTSSDLENIKDPYFQYMFTNSGTKKAAFVQIKDVRKNWIGFLSVNFLYEKDDIHIEQIKEYADKIGILLSRNIT